MRLTALKKNQTDLPLRQAGQEALPLYPIASQTLYINFGFWGVFQSSAGNALDHFQSAGRARGDTPRGIQSLYSHSCFTHEEYGVPHYEVLKASYDPQHRLPGLYEKCVMKV